MFAIGPSPCGTGVGMIALRDIDNGVPVVSEQPAIRLPRRVLDARDASEAYCSDIVRGALDIMDDAGVQRFRELLGNSDLEKLRTNCCALQPSINEVGVFFSFARVNHSCRPNAVNMVDEDAMTLIAQRDIKAGEEITISYFVPADDILLDRTGRQARLHQRMKQFGSLGWDCRCKLCTASDAEVSASDRIRQEIREIKGRFMSAVSNQRQIEDYQAMIQLGAKDGLCVFHSLGEQVILKCQQIFNTVPEGQVQSGLDSESNSLNFPIGSRVVLFKLVAKPELNGRTGTVIEELNKNTRRVGVVLDCEGGLELRLR